MKSFRADLHVHTCLSPCAGLLMSPRKIVEAAKGAGIDIVGICDHNSAENAAAAVEAGRQAGVTVLPGMEITSAEDVHILGLFENVEQALRIQRVVYDSLEGENDEDYFGVQAIVNASDEVEGFNPRLLIGATSLTVERVVEEIHRAGGLAIASHADREVYGIVGVLGFVPPGLPLDAVEVSKYYDLAADGPPPGCEGYPVLRSSDAHIISEVGGASSSFTMAEATFAELALALAGEGGRSVETAGAGE